MPLRRIKSPESDLQLSGDLILSEFNRDQLATGSPGVHAARWLLGYGEAEARHEPAQRLGHNSHRIEVTYAYVPRRTNLL